MTSAARREASDGGGAAAAGGKVRDMWWRWSRRHLDCSGVSWFVQNKGMEGTAEAKKVNLFRPEIRKVFWLPSYFLYIEKIEYYIYKFYKIVK
jgi:hypothetical protein